MRAVKEAGPATLAKKVEIRLGPDAHRVNREAVDALAKHSGIYQRGGELVRVGLQAKAGRQAPTPVPLHTMVLHSILSEVADFRGDNARQLPPDWCVGYVKNVGEWPGVPELSYVVEHPVLRPDGTVLQKKGYDAKTRIMYAPSMEFEPVPDEPTQNDVVAARERLLDLVCDFPFSQPIYRSAWLAGLLTFFARPAYDGSTPFFLVDANVRGAGKGFLCHVASLIATGRRMPTATQPADEAEDGKLITSVCRAGDVVKLIDNISRPFGTGKFDAALTTTVWEDRLLGQSQLLSLPHYCIWWGTGNNVQFHSRADTARRTLHIRLLSPEQNPENRTQFKHPNLGRYILQNRGQFVADCLTLLRAYQRAKADGVPSLKPWGSFEEWSECVRGAVVYAGLPDPIEAHEHLTQMADTSARSLADLIEGWAELCKDHEVDACSVRQALDWLVEDGEYKQRQPGHQLRFLRLRDAISELCSTNGKPLPDARQLGYALRSFRGRVIGGRYLETAGAGEEGKQWKVCER